MNQVSLSRRRTITSACLLAGASIFVSNSVSAATVAYQAAVLADSPYAYYRLGETSGTTAADLSGNGRTATYLNGPTLGAAGSGGDTAVSFDGTNDSVQLDNNTNNFYSFGAALNSFSLEFAVKTTSTATLKGLFGVANLGSTTGINVVLNSSASGSALANSTRFFLRDEAGGSLNVAFTNAELYSGNYVDLVFAFDATTGLSAYVNGTAQTLTFAGNTITGSSTFANFGFDPYLAAIDTRGTIGAWSAATIDEASFFTSKLSGVDVADHYAAFAAVPEPDAWALLLGGVAGLILVRRRSSSRSSLA